VNLLARTVDLLPSAYDFKCELGAALRASSEVDEAERVLLEATEAPELVTRLRAAIEVALVRSSQDPDRVSELLDVTSAALPALEASGDDRALGRAWLCLGHVRGGFYCEYAALEEAATRAATHYKRGGWSPSTAFEYLGTALFFGPTPVEPALAKCAQILIEHVGDRASEANIIAWQGGLEAMLGRFDEGRALVARARSIYEELGLEGGAVDICGRVLGAIEMLAGHPEKAVEALRASCELAQRLGQMPLLATRAGTLAAAMYAEQNYDEAATWVDLARESAGADDLDAALSWQPVQALLLAKRGQLGDATDLARTTVASARKTDSLIRQGDSLMVLAAVLSTGAKDDEAHALVDEAVRAYEKKGNLVAAERARALRSSATVAE
jgi:tetratricopeptide (TPR) repeat protein